MTGDDGDRRRDQEFSGVAGSQRDDEIGREGPRNTNCSGIRQKPVAFAGLSGNGDRQISGFGILNVDVRNAISPILNMGGNDDRFAIVDSVRILDLRGETVRGLSRRNDNCSGHRNQCRI